MSSHAKMRNEKACMWRLLNLFTEDILVPAVAAPKELILLWEYLHKPVLPRSGFTELEV